MRQINPRIPSMMLAGIRLTKYRGIPESGAISEWTRITPAGDVRIIPDGETREVAH
jgi:hypothetical protein